MFLVCPEDTVFPLVWVVFLVRGIEAGSIVERSIDSNGSTRRRQKMNQKQTTTENGLQRLVHDCKEVATLASRND